MNRAKVGLLRRSHAMSSLRSLLAIALVVVLFAPGGATAKAGPDGFADLAAKLLPAVVNISSTQTIKPDRGGGGGNRANPGPDAPQFPPCSPFEEFFKDFLNRNQRQGQGQPQAAPRQQT